jgi:hypothetical protein
MFINYGLDISQKPEPLKFTYNDNEWKLDIGNKVYYATSETNVDEELTISKLFMLDKATQQCSFLYEIKQRDYFYMASSGKIHYVAGYMKGKKIVFLTLFYHTNYMAGDTDTEIYHFTPVFEIE